jgi:putative chitinase
MEIVAANITEMSRTATPRIIHGIVDNQQLITDGGINTPLRLCHFMAQLAHESAHFGVTLEFASGKAYEGRKILGNIHVGDGPRYRGRGLIQTTGRTNYQLARDDIRMIVPDAPDFEADPVKLEEFPWALLSAISYWRRRNIARLADRDDVVAVTRAINGGENGLADRKRYLAKAKAIWIDDNTPTAGHSTVRPGDKGGEVEELQHVLVAAGYRVLVDGDFGDNTKNAVMDFQKRKGLPADGVVGLKTWGLLQLIAG